MNVTATLFGQMITFIVFVWFIKAYLWEPLTQAMENRTKKISEGLAAAEQGQKKIEQATIEFSTRIDQAKTEASSIRFFPQILQPSSVPFPLKPVHC